MYFFINLISVDFIIFVMMDLYQYMKRRFHFSSPTEQGIKWALMSSGNENQLGVHWHRFSNFINIEIKIMEFID